MEYEMINKVQTGTISPSKLRMKLIGSQRKKHGSKCSSSRTSPNRPGPEDSEFVKNSLLAAPDGSFVEEATSFEVEPIISDTTTSDHGSSSQGKELRWWESNKGVPARARTPPNTKPNFTSSSSVHPTRSNEDESFDYDSTSSFEFHKGDHSLHRPPHQVQPAATHPLTRPVPSKWNDAEKWIQGRQDTVQPTVLKRTSSQNQACRPLGRVELGLAVPAESCCASVKRIDFVHAVVHTVPSKLVCGDGAASSSPSTVDLCLSETEETTGPAMRSVSMRDMGTEMTPIPSQEPSRSATPITSTTPIRSPASSVPPTPPRGEPAPTPTGPTICIEPPRPTHDSGKKELSEEEVKLNTRREIAWLGVQLGKTNIAAWASGDKTGVSGNNGAYRGKPVRIEYARRAAAWEEAERWKHAARLQREEMRIEAWESQQKARLEAELRKIQARIEQMQAYAQAKMVKKVALVRHKSEERRASAKTMKNRQLEKTAAQAELIRHTGRIRASPFYCCGWV